MSIRVSGLPNITADDLRWTYRGRSFGVELSSLAGFGNFISVVETFADGRPAAFIGRVQTSCEDSDITKAGGPLEWIKTVFLPWLKAVLADLFPADGVEQPMTEFEKVDKILAGSVKIVSKPDGSLDAVLTQ